MRVRVQTLTRVLWLLAGLALVVVAAGFWRALRRALLPRVHVDGTSVPAGVAPDGAGGAVVALTATGTTDVGCGDPFSDRGLVLARFDSGGKCVWKKPIRGAAAAGLAASGAGDLVLAADVYDNADFGFGPTASFSSLALTGYDAAGKPRWSRSLDARVALTASQRSRQMLAVSRDGTRVAALVATHNLADLGGGKLATRNSPHDAALLLIDGSSGNTLRSRYLGAVLFGGVAFAASGHVIVTGTFVGEMDAGGGAWRAADDDGEVFVLELDSRGDTLRAAKLGPGDGLFVAAGDDGRIFVAGAYAQRGPDLGGAVPACAESACTFVAELDASLAPIHHQTIVGAAPRGVAAERGAVYVAGDRPPPFLLRVDERPRFGGGLAEIHGLDQVDGIVIDASGRVVVAGRTGSGPHAGAGIRWVLP